MSLDSIAGSSASTEDKKERYMALLEDKLGMGDVEALQAAVDHIMQEEVPQAISRKVMSHIAPLMRKMLPAAKFEEVADYTVRQIRSNQTFEDADFQLRQDLFAHYKESADFVSAANALAGIALENASSLTDASAEQKANAVANHYVTVAETFLVHPDQTVEAENYVNKATTYMNDVTDRNLLLRYKVTHSQVGGCDNIYL